MFLSDSAIYRCIRISLPKRIIGFPWHNTKLHLMGRLQSWRSVEYEVPPLIHSSKIWTRVTNYISYCDKHTTKNVWHVNSRQQNISRDFKIVHFVYIWYKLVTIGYLSLTQRSSVEHMEDTIYSNSQLTNSSV